MGCEIWRYDGKNFEKVVDKGFGDINNSGAWSVIEYRGKLYVGTMNWKEGCQIWRTDDGINWENYKTEDGLADNYVRDIEVDKKNNICF